MNMGASRGTSCKRVRTRRARPSREVAPVLVLQGGVLKLLLPGWVTVVIVKTDLVR
jgi:hypothetical protein